MKIKTVNVVRNEIDIELPLFWKHPIDETYLGVLDENTVVSMTFGSYRHVTHCELWLKTGEIEKANAEWTRIDEAMFLTAHKKMLSSLSLQPVLIHKTINQDDLNDVL